MLIDYLANILNCKEFLFYIIHTWFLKIFLSDKEGGFF